MHNISVSQYNYEFSIGFKNEISQEIQSVFFVESSRSQSAIQKTPHTKPHTEYIHVG